jgi:hypothetical protein
VDDDWDFEQPAEVESAEDPPVAAVDETEPEFAAEVAEESQPETGSVDDLMASVLAPEEAESEPEPTASTDGDSMDGSEGGFDEESSVETGAEFDDGQAADMDSEPTEDKTAEPFGDAVDEPDQVPAAFDAAPESEIVVDEAGEWPAQDPPVDDDLGVSHAETEGADEPFESEDVPPDVAEEEPASFEAEPAEEQFAEGESFGADVPAEDQGIAADGEPDAPEIDEPEAIAADVSVDDEPAQETSAAEQEWDEAHTDEIVVDEAAEEEARAIEPDGFDEADTPMAAEAAVDVEVEEEEIVEPAVDEIDHRPFTIGEGDPFGDETDDQATPVRASVEPQVAISAPMVENAGEGIVRAGDNQLHLRLQGTGAIAESGQVRALDIEVPVPGSWVGNRRVTLQLRLTLTPVAEEEDGGPGDTP